MTRREQIQHELGAVASLLSEWDEDAEELSAEWLGRQSLLRRQTNLLHEATLHEEDHQFQVVLQGASVHGHAVETDFIGSFLKRLQRAVTAIVDGSMGETGTRGSFTTDVLEASQLKLVATGAGSFALGLEGREYPAQAELGDDGVPSTPLEEALDRLLTVIDAAESDVDGTRLRSAASELGGNRAIKRTVDLSDLISKSGTSARFINRDRRDGAISESRLSPGVASRLSGVLDDVVTTEDTEIVRGRLSGVVWQTKLFHLEPDSGDVDIIRGTVVEELRSRVDALFDQHVVAKLIKRTVRLSVDADESTSYTMIDVHSAEHTSGAMLPSIDQ